MLTKFLIWIVLVISLTNCATTKQTELAGDWSGTLSVAGASLRLVFHITDSAIGLTTVLESVDQQNAMIPAVTVVDGDSISFFVESLDVEYVATVMGDTIVGEFTQLGNSMPNFVISKNE